LGDDRPLLNKISFLHANLSNAPGELGGDIDSLDLDASIGARETGRHSRRHLGIPVQIAAACEGERSEDSQGGRSTHQGTDTMATYRS
jgi:hypothetical protein